MYIKKTRSSMYRNTVIFVFMSSIDIDILMRFQRHETIEVVQVIKERARVLEALQIQSFKFEIFFIFITFMIMSK